MPAVSIKRKFTPSRWTLSEIKSRVVPAILVTMDLSSPNKALKKVLFPEFGWPTRTISGFKSLAESPFILSQSLFILFIKLEKLSNNCLFPSCSPMSSRKSMLSSTLER